jgi:hypothetical protein
LKFTKKHNRVARKNMLKVRKVKLSAAGKGKTSLITKVKRMIAPRIPEQIKTTWSLSSILKNVTSYFTGETSAHDQGARKKRRSPAKKKEVADTTKTTPTVSATKK